MPCESLKWVLPMSGAISALQHICNEPVAQALWPSYGYEVPHTGDIGQLGSSASVRLRDPALAENAVLSHRSFCTGVLTAIVTVLLSVAYTTAGAPRADASTASISGATLTYSAGVGETNQVDLSVAAGVIKVFDGAGITAGSGCAPVDVANVQCTLAGTTTVDANLGDEDDHLTALTFPIVIIAQGGPGADRLLGGFGDDQLSGGGGNDTFDDGCCIDTNPPLNDDIYDGGPDTDTMIYASASASVTVTLDDVANDGLDAEQDNVKANVENVTGGSGSDLLTGDDDANVLNAGGGNDNTLNGKGGNDTLTVAFSATGTLSGGDGADRLIDDSSTPGSVLNGGAGADELSNSGLADTLNGDDGNDTLMTSGAGNLFGGADDDVLVDWQNQGPNVLSGGPGDDTVDYSDHGGPLVVRLDGLANDGNTSFFGSEGDNVDVENIIGTFGGDTLVGDAKDNLFDGGAGGDTIAGAAGQDTVDYSARSANLSVTEDGHANDGDGTDGVLTTSRDNVSEDIEIIEGGSGNDGLVGGSGTNDLRGNDGNDVLDGGRGPDSLRGGAGTDTASYSSATSSIEATLDGLTDDGPSGESDNIDPDHDVENLAGGPGDDLLVADGSANVVGGAAGDDLLYGGPGADRLAGGAGLDAADYSDRETAVAVSIDGAANDGNADDGPAAARDNVGPDVEDLFSGAGNDVLTGSAASNLLNGGPGADSLVGLAGEDIADYSDRQAAVDVSLDGAPNDGNAEDGPAGARDRVAGDIEDVLGGAGGDTLSGNAAENVLIGGSGGDLVTGGDGEDLLFGDAGDDSLNSRDTAADAVSCGEGADSVAADGLDQVVQDCESVALPTPLGTQPAQPPLAADTVAPTISIKPRSRQSLGSVLARGLVVTVGCSEAGSITAQLRLSRRVARRYKLTRLVIGRSSGTLAARGNLRLIVKLGAQAKRRLKRARSLAMTLVVKARDRSDNRATARRTLKLRRSSAASSSALATRSPSQAPTGLLTHARAAASPRRANTLAVQREPHR